MAIALRAIYLKRNLVISDKVFLWRVVDCRDFKDYKRTM